MGNEVTSSVNAPATQAGLGAVSTSKKDGLAQTEFVKAKESAIADKQPSTDQEYDTTQTRGTDKKNLCATAIGAGIIDRHPQGHTLAVPDNFDRAKIKAYEQRIKDPFDRGVGLRSADPNTGLRTDDIRNRKVNKDMVKDYAAKHGGRPPGTQVDHLVEYQHVIRPNPSAPGADTVRKRDHRFLAGRDNQSQGSSAQHEDRRRMSAGSPQDIPAGGVAKVSDLNKITNTQAYRTVVRAAGVYSTAGGTYAALKGVGEDIRDGNLKNAALGTSAYLGGAFELGAVANLAVTGSQSTVLLNGARILGAPAAVVGAFVGGHQIGTHLYENYVNQEGAMDAGAWAEDKFDSRVAGGVAAAGYAIGSAAYHAPDAAVDYVKDNVTLNPSEVDWDRTLKPWKWF